MEAIETRAGFDVGGVGGVGVEFVVGVGEVVVKPPCHSIVIDAGLALPAGVVAVTVYVAVPGLAEAAVH
jgi:hypothetical protein